MAYAKGTEVSVQGSVDEIRKTVRRFGADRFQLLEADDMAAIGFTAQERHVRFRMALPDRKDKRFTQARINQHGGTQLRAHEAAEKLWLQACAEKWRALAAVVKAKLVAVEAGISTFEEEFLAHVVMPSGRTLYEEVREPIKQAYLSGEVRPLLEGPRS